jgi:nucleoside-diphosphate-sugar epimerase
MGGGAMKVLVTGAPGWLGTRLVEMMRQRNMDVRCLVVPDADDTLLKKLGAGIFRGDLLKSESLKGACDGIDTVFHCAGLIHPDKTKELYRINKDGTGNMLAEAVRAGSKKFIYVSSNSVGGVNVSRDKLLTESDAPRPYMHYGMSKQKAEDIVNKAFRDGAIKTTIIRPCWFYGIRQPERQTRFFRMIKKGNPIVFGDGNNLRSLSYIDNIVDALLLIDQKAISNGKTYWIADARPYSTIQIYQTIAKLLDVKDFKPLFVPGIVSALFRMADSMLQAVGLYIKEVHVAGEMDRDIACSIETARRELGYEPKVDLEEGMKRSIEWCRANGIEI